MLIGMKTKKGPQEEFEDEDDEEIEDDELEAAE